MMYVVDASALLAALLGETGADRVGAVIDGAVMSTVNLAEVVGYYARAGGDRAAIAAMLGALPLSYAAPDEEVAIDAGLMRPLTERAGLSLGDRMCLALAKRMDAAALTADRTWADFATQLDVRIELIR